MIPVEQTCPKCGTRFMGSDVVGLPCHYCMGLSDETLAEMLSAMNQMYYQPEEETNDRPRTD